MTEGPAPGDETTKHKYVYDAWNRLVEVTDNSDVTIVSFEYDGLNRRIVKTDEEADPDIDYDYYYNEQWQALEVRKDADTDPLHQYVWHPFYIDALAVMYYDADTDNSGIEELYATFDANMNATALMNSSGTVQERYEYDSYGQPSILDADFSADADGASDKENDILFGGYRYDTESGLYHVRNRMLHPSLGRWIQRDPAQYIDGANLYIYALANPLRGVDPMGLACTQSGCTSSSPPPQWSAQPGCCAKRNLVGSACTNCCLTNCSDWSWRVECMTACETVNCTPGRVYDVDTDFECGEICKLKGSGSGRTFCDSKGNPRACNCIPNKANLPRWQKHVRRCVTECEGIHLCNATCTGPVREPTDPNAPTQDCGISCSECSVNSCMLDCLASLDCSKTTNPVACDFYKNEVRQFRNDECRKCQVGCDYGCGLFK